MRKSCKWQEERLCNVPAEIPQQGPVEDVNAYPLTADSGSGPVGCTQLCLSTGGGFSLLFILL